MAVHRARFTVGTRSRVEVRNITPEVLQALRGCPLREGILCVSLPHTTCALALNEDEGGLRQDLERLAAGLLDPLRHAGSFIHDRIDNNAQSHLTATLLSPSLTVSMTGGAPSLGTWQSVLLVEMDGPRTRIVDLTVVG